MKTKESKNSIYGPPSCSHEPARQPTEGSKPLSLRYAARCWSLVTLPLLLAACWLSTGTLVAATKVAAWGHSGYGQTNVPAGLGNVVAIAGGGLHSLGLKSDGTVVGWGYNYFGQANAPAGLSNVVAIAGGAHHSLALKSNGTVVGWGYNDYGQTSVPAGLSNVVAIAAGVHHSLALKSNGTVVGWGFYSHGQTTVPAGLSNVVAIAAGYFHSLALKSDGTVAAWGSNGAGETSVPAGLSNVVAIASGERHCLALKRDGTVAAWGYNAYGQTSVPAGLSNVVAIAAGYHHSLALKSDGTVVSWGYKTIVPAGLNHVQAIAGGADHSLALYIPPAPPFADAGDDQTVDEGALVTLDGARSHSNDPATSLTYQWTQLSGPAVSLSDPAWAVASFNAPQVPDAGAALVFQLTVSDGAAPPVSDTVTINVANVNTPPTANPGGAQTVAENATVVLSGGGSDPDGDPLTLTWTQTGGQPVTLTGSDTSTPSFTAPPVSFAEGSTELEFQLVVNDGQVNSGPATVTVHVLNINAPPAAVAGTDQSVNELEDVTLDGSASSDPDGNPLTYAWTQIGGSPEVTLTGADTATASFTAPEVALGGATLTFELTVRDHELSSTATVSVRISNVNHAPLADAGEDQTVPSNGSVSLDGSDSADTDGDVLTYAWVQTGGPAVTLSATDTAAISFTAPVAGPAGIALQFKLTVDDGYGGTTSDETVVNVTYVNHVPSADAGVAQTVSEGGAATLAGTASDPDGNDLSYAWTQISGPPVILINAATLTPGFVAPFVTRAEENVALRLIVDDGYGGSAGSEVTIHIANINHAPTAQAPANLDVFENDPVSLIGQGTDPDIEEQSQLGYFWQQVSGPAVTLTGAGADVGFTAPLVTAGGDPNAKETLVFRLTVTDPNGVAATDDIDVTVSNVKHAPAAVAGGNLTANEAASVTLNGSASSDPDGDNLTFVWEQTAGPAVALSDAHAPYPYFTAPFVNAGGETLKFKLTVDDGFGGTSSDTATVTVANINDQPTVTNAQPSLATLWPPDHSMLKASILGIVDPNNNATITITGVTQDEATNGLGDGDTAIDAIISADRTSVLLRAERSGRGDGRVYRIAFTASDFEGSASGVIKVRVPHNKKSEMAVDGGERFDSTR